MSVSDTIGLLSENGSFQWKEADPVGKGQEVRFLLLQVRQEQILKLWKEYNSLKESLFLNATNLICVCVSERQSVCVCVCVWIQMLISKVLPIFLGLKGPSAH